MQWFDSLFLFDLFVMREFMQCSISKSDIYRKCLQAFSDETVMNGEKKIMIEISEDKRKKNAINKQWAHIITHIVTVNLECTETERQTHEEAHRSHSTSTQNSRVLIISVWNSFASIYSLIKALCISITITVTFSVYLEKQIPEIKRNGLNNGKMFRWPCHFESVKIIKSRFSISTTLKFLPLQFNKLSLLREKNVSWNFNILFNIFSTFFFVI